MTDHRERACFECGSLLHHEDDCQRTRAWDPFANQVRYEVADALHNEAECGRRCQAIGVQNFVLNMEMMAVHAARAKCAWVWSLEALLRWVQ